MEAAGFGYKKGSTQVILPLFIKNNNSLSSLQKLKMFNIYSSSSSSLIYAIALAAMLMCSVLVYPTEAATCQKKTTKKFYYIKGRLCPYPDDYINYLPY